MKKTFRTHGVCATQIDIEVENGIIQNVKFTGGCNGNSKGLSSLVEGMKIDDVIKKTSGIDCGGRGTSCPDQLANFLKEMK